MIVSHVATAGVAAHQLIIRTCAHSYAGQDHAPVAGNFYLGTIKKHSSMAPYPIF